MDRDVPPFQFDLSEELTQQYQEYEQAVELQRTALDLRLGATSQEELSRLNDGGFFMDIGVDAGR